MKYYFLLFFCLFFINSQAQDRLIPYLKGDKWGYVNENKEIIIPCIYVDAHPFSEGLALVSKDMKEGYYQYGYIDKKGKTVIPFQYGWGHAFNNGYAYVETYDNEEGNRWGIINTKNDVVIPIKNMCAPIPLPPIEEKSFHENLMPVMNTDLEAKMGVMNEKGRTVIPFGKFDYIEDFSEGLAGFRKVFNGKTGFINAKGEVIIEPEYYHVGKFSEGLARVRLYTNNADDDFLTGFIDKIGKKIIPMEYFTFQDFSEGLVAVAHKNNPAKVGFIDAKGKTIISFEYQAASSFKNGIAAVVKNDKVGYINKKGKVIIPFQFDYDNERDIETYNFYEERAIAKKGEKWGFIDLKGNVVIDFKYYEVGDAFGGFPYFKNGLIKVNDSKETAHFFYIDKDENEYFEE